MNDENLDNQEAQEEITPLRRFSSRHQYKQLRFSEDTEQHQQQQQQQTKSLTSPKFSARKNRFLSIYDSSVQFPTVNIRRLRQLHDQVTKNENLSVSEEITDELLDKLPFKIQIISDQEDNFSIGQSPLAKKRNQNNREMIETSKVIPSSLTEERRLEIIEEVFNNLNKQNVFDETRRAHAIPFELPKNNQMQKNVAERIRDLTGNDIVMLNDHVYMKTLCKILDGRYKKTLEEKFKKLEINGNRRYY